MRQYLSDAPANIALIKYMGKKNKETNQPANASLSYTLNHLRTYVSLEPCSGKHDVWEPLELPGTDSFHLSPLESERYLKHLSLIKERLSFKGSFIVRSANNFPASTGLASSASSFAALTKCALIAICDLQQIALPSVAEQANLSREGSGSSCRSFFSPWSFWDDEGVHAVSLPYEELIHEVILVSHAPKTVSSSEAHRRVETSPLYPQRLKHAKQHLDALLDALFAQKWEEAYLICWREFQEMHALFASCAQPFSYMTEQTHDLLNQLQADWVKTGDGPLVTMDAGPNIHLLYRLDQKEQARLFKQDVLIGNVDVL